MFSWGEPVQHVDRLITSDLRSRWHGYNNGPWISEDIRVLDGSLSCGDGSQRIQSAHEAIFILLREMRKCLSERVPPRDDEAISHYYETMCCDDIGTLCVRSFSSGFSWQFWVRYCRGSDSVTLDASPFGGSLQVTVYYLRRLGIQRLNVRPVYFEESIKKHVGDWADKLI